MSNKRKTGSLVSVIVPVYCVEEYLFRCVDSLVKQTYHNLEIILVDDGSLDNCGKLCDDWAKNDSRIKVIHKKNSGLASARNAGLDVCTGDYILFVDSDDYVASNIVEFLLNDIQQSGADISICDYIPFNEQHTYSNKYPNKKFVISGKEKWEFIVSGKQNNSYGSVSVVQWNKLFKSEIFKKLRFQEGKVNEDEFIIAEEFGLADRISYNLEPLYYYLQRDNSIIHTFSVNRFDAIDAYDQRIAYFKKHHLDEYAQRTISLKIIFLTYLVGRNYKEIRKNKEYKAIAKHYIDENASNAKRLIRTDIGKKDKIRIRLLLYFPYLLSLILSSKSRLSSGGANNV